jgi:hypothetical protein
MVAMEKERLCYHFPAENRGKFFAPSSAVHPDRFDPNPFLTADVSDDRRSQTAKWKPLIHANFR